MGAVMKGNGPDLSSMLTCKDIYLIIPQLWLLCSSSASSLPNVAPLGTASQSSTYEYGVASTAIDENRNPSFYAGSCTHTLPALSNWWSLLLPAVYRFTEIRITNRDEVDHRISNAELLIGNSMENNGNDNPRCTVISSIPAAGTSIFNCAGMFGRLINVKLEGTNPEGMLTICELEAYGEIAAPSPSSSAVVMGRGVALVEKKLCWSDALFYCRDFYWDLLSVRSEMEQKEVENVIKSTNFALTKHVWLGLRRYLMGDTWFWMPGATESYSHWEKQATWKVTSPCGAMDTSGSFYWRDVPCGEHLHFICLKDIQRDRKRVKFFSTTRP